MHRYEHPHLQNRQTLFFMEAVSYFESSVHRPALTLFQNIKLCTVRLDVLCKRMSKVAVHNGSSNVVLSI